MTSVGHDIVVMSTFHSLIRHRGHYDRCQLFYLHPPLLYTPCQPFCKYPTIISPTNLSINTHHSYIPLPPSVYTSYPPIPQTPLSLSVPYIPQVPYTFNPLSATNRFINLRLSYLPLISYCQSSCIPPTTFLLPRLLSTLTPHAYHQPSYIF